MGGKRKWKKSHRTSTLETNPGGPPEFGSEVVEKVNSLFEKKFTYNLSEEDNTRWSGEKILFTEDLWHDDVLMKFKVRI